ncbi:MAG: 2-dehydropantoate 2-reductase [Saprospiraceae bacterium]
MKIAIIGIGGVGGYFGGQLAAHYQNNKDVEIYFIARGEHLKEIKKNGLKIIHGDNQWVTHPTLATDRPSEMGIMDIVIFSVKTFDLEASVLQMQPCIGENTVLIPLLNGVNSRERIQAILSDATIWDGLVYIIARLTKAGEVENMGNIQKLYFGYDGAANNKMQAFEEILKAANIDATLSTNMSTIIWEKFIFISSIATLTSFLNNSIGEIMVDDNKKQLLGNLIDEIKSIAFAKNISINPAIKESVFIRLQSLPFEATSSMHSDFKNKKSKTELVALTGFVVEQGRNLNIETPTYNRMFNELNNLN